MQVFISYRRNDSQDVAARLADRLTATRGIYEVFIDVEDIEAGADFARRIDDAIANSDVCLVLIGKAWTGPEPDGARARIHDEDDFVRREVAAALRSGLRVIPVLINDAPMPAVESLPADIAQICARNAIALRHASFNQDLEILIDAVFRRGPRGPVARWLRRHPMLGGLLRSLGGMAGAGATLIGLAAVHQATTGGKALSETLGGPGLVWLLILFALALGAVLPLWLRRRR